MRSEIIQFPRTDALFVHLSLTQARRALKSAMAAESLDVRAFLPLPACLAEGNTEQFGELRPFPVLRL